MFSFLVSLQDPKFNGFYRSDPLHCIKMLVIFPSPSGMSLTKLILAGEGKIANLFHSVDVGLERTRTCDVSASFLPLPALARRDSPPVPSQPDYLWNKKKHYLGKSLPGSSLPVNLRFVVDRKRRKRVHCSTLLNPCRRPTSPQTGGTGGLQVLVLIFDKTFMYILSL